MVKVRAATKPPPATKKAKKKRNTNGPKSAAMKSSEVAEKSNPFDTIWSRTKFSVLGRRRKGEQRRVGLSRALSIQKRDKTLLREYEENAKSSKFIDKRIGEKDDTLPEFDKAILRWQRVHQSKLKKARKYNLTDGDDDPATLLSLSERDDFEDNESIEDGDDHGSRGSLSHLELQTAGALSEDGMADEDQNGNENNHKTKKQAYQEMISKSKYFKAQKAKEKEEDELLTDKLDKDFSSLAQNEALISLTLSSNMASLKALLTKDGTEKSKKREIVVDKVSSKQEKSDAYDKLVKEMALDMRARPTDRTKTPEEAAQEERERLELLEEERKKRMLATDDSDGEESDNSEGDEKAASKKSRPLSGDDLGDSFSIDVGTRNKNGWVDDIMEREENASEEDTSSEDSESEEDDQDKDGFISNDGDEFGAQLTSTASVKDWEQSDTDGVDTDVENQGHKVKETFANEIKTMRGLEGNSFEGKAADSKDVFSATKAILPFVLEAPNNLVELCSLLDNRPDTEVVEAIKRIRACNSVRLSAENRRKMQVFYGVLLQYFAVVTTRRPLNMNILNSLMKPLVEMSGETPYFAAICARERLVSIRTKFCEDIKIPEKSSWPSSKTLFLLRFWSLVFPCSDFRHVVMTPAVLLMCEYLMRCPIICTRDVALGTFLCSMVLSVTKQSRKFCPEAMVFLENLFMCSLGSKAGSQEPSPVCQLMEYKEIKPLLHISSDVSDVQPVDFLVVVDMEADSPFFQTDDFKAGVLVSAVETLRGFVEIYGGLSSSSELFSSFSGPLRDLAQNRNIPHLLRGKLQGVEELIRKKADEQQRLWQPLQLRKAKPEAIKLLNPKFEENFVKGRDYDPDREKVERRKLKKLLKGEWKGAIRELRKDNHYLFQLKEKDRLQQEEEKAERYGKARAFLQEQEHAFKSGQLGKGRKRRR